VNHAGLLDTSIFIASETGRPLAVEKIPDEVATTVITLTELTAGVLAAQTADIRAQRLATLDAVGDMTALPVDEDAARMWARMRIHLAEAKRKVGVNDLWIAAIAASRELPVVTQDGDFDPLDGVAGLTVIRV